MPFFASGQKNYVLVLKVQPEQGRSDFKIPEYPRVFADTLQRSRALQRVMLRLYAEGYLEAEIGSVRNDSARMTALLNPGLRYPAPELRRGNVGPEQAKKWLPGSHSSRLKSFEYAKLVALTEKILQDMENEGYPFASLTFDSLDWRGNVLTAALNLQKNGRIIIDSLVVTGSARIRQVCLTNYTGIRPHDLYDESKIRRLGKRLEEIRYVKVTRPPEVLFGPGSATVLLFLDKRSAGSFDGVLGLAPNSGQSKKLLVTGDVALNLLNPFGQGESIGFNWRQLEQQSQDLKLDLAFPFVLATPFGADYSFSLYKKDTSFLTVTQNIGVRYEFSGNTLLKVFTNLRKSSLLSTAGFERLTALPPYADVSSSLFGLEFRSENLDYRLNPSSGYKISLSFAAGAKTIRKNSKINPVLYKSLKMNSDQYRINAGAELYLPLASRFTLLLGNQAGAEYSSGMFENELFRIGGLRTLRGFDEESLLASLYSVMTLEFRYLFEENSNFHVFCDAAYFENQLQSGFSCDRPAGFGAGISFFTRAGIFSVSYALGTRADHPLLLRDAKVHFGIVNNF